MNDFKDKPDRNREFTTREIADALNISQHRARGILIKLGFESYIKKTSDSRCAVWSYEAYKAVKKVVSTADRNAVKKYRAEQESLNMEQLLKCHPLVTNPRWLRLSAFPETIPAGYEDVQFEEVRKIARR